MPTSKKKEPFLTKFPEQCYICGNEIGLKFTFDMCDLYECSGCLHQFFFPYPKGIKTLYERSDYYYDGQKAPLFFKKNYQHFPQYKTFASRLSEIRSLTRPLTPKILDVGCGTGLFVKLCSQQNVEAVGIDFSNTAIQVAKKLKSNCYQQDFLKDITASQFDVITMFDVLEHLSNPSDFVEKAHYSLRKAGVTH